MLIPCTPSAVWICNSEVLWGPVLAVQSRGSSMVPTCTSFLLLCLPPPYFLQEVRTPKCSLRPFPNKLPAHKSLFWVLLLRKLGLRQRRAPQHRTLNKKPSVSENTVRKPALLAATMSSSHFISLNLSLLTHEMG